MIGIFDEEFNKITEVAEAPTPFGNAPLVPGLPQKRIISENKLITLAKKGNLQRGESGKIRGSERAPAGRIIRNNYFSSSILRVCTLLPAETRYK